MELCIFWEWGIDIAGDGSRLCGNFLQKTFWFFLLNKWWLFVVFVDSVSAPLGCLSSPKLMLRRNLLIFSFISSTIVASVWKRFAVFPFCVSFIVRKHHLSCIYSVEELESVRDFSSFSSTLIFWLYRLWGSPLNACYRFIPCVRSLNKLLVATRCLWAHSRVSVRGIFSL